MANGDALPKAVPTVDTFSSTAVIHPFLCSKEHILGVIITEIDQRYRVRVNRLLLFRRAFEQGEPIPPSAGFAKIDEGEVMCGICGDIRRWERTQPHRRQSR